MFFDHTRSNLKKNENGEFPGELPKKVIKKIGRSCVMFFDQTSSKKTRYPPK